MGRAGRSFRLHNCTRNGAKNLSEGICMTPHEKLQLEKIRAMISALYPGQFNFDRSTVAKIIGCTKEHLSNRECDGKPLIRTVALGRKRVTQLPDLIDFLFNQRREGEKNRKRGPRTKSERIASQGGESRYEVVSEDGGKL